MLNRPEILHIPHSSRNVLGGGYLLNESEISAQMDVLTDHATDELLQLAGAARVVFKYSRLSVDPERFWENAAEPMASLGMGALYERCPDGTMLRDLGACTKEQLGQLRAVYQGHHRQLEDLTRQCIESFGYCLIFDCHSFPKEPLPFEDSSLRRPEICLGADDYHTPPALLESAVAAFTAQGWEVGVNEPFSGSIVPLSCYQVNPQALSLMVEVRRDLYWNQTTMSPTSDFNDVQERLSAAISKVAGFLHLPSAKN